MSTMDCCTLRMLHYPPCASMDDVDSDDAAKCLPFRMLQKENTKHSNSGVDSTSSIRVGEHTDFGIFTFLFVNDFHDESSHGLQVKAVEGSDLNNKNDESFYRIGWNDVIFDKELLGTVDDDETCAVVVNTGALMARWTNDVWRATAHRVIVSSTQARLAHRYSIAMFFDPDGETVCSVHPKLIEKSGEAKHAPIKSVDYLMMKLKEAQGVAN